MAIVAEGGRPEYALDCAGGGAHYTRLDLESSPQDQGPLKTVVASLVDLVGGHTLLFLTIQGRWPELSVVVVIVVPY